MRTQPQWTVGHGTTRRHKSHGVRAIGAVMISSALACTLLAQVASSQTLDRSDASVRPNAVRAARRHQAPQLDAHDVVVDNAKPQLRPKTPTIDVRGAVNGGIRTALQDARFGEADSRIEGSLKRGQQVSPSQRTVLVLPLQDARFGEAGFRGGGCYPWGCGENSPIVEGANVFAQPTEVRSATRRSN
jgi:hypothetical protein